MKAIFAVDSAGGIGKNGSLPWPKNKEDFAWFKKHTMHQKVLMGRRTWDDPVFPKPLKGRQNIVLTQSTIDVEGVVCIQSLEAPLIQDAIVIGGARLITSIADKLDTIYLTRFEQDYKCDTFIDIDSLLENFSITERTQSKNIAFEVWKRCNNI